LAIVAIGLGFLAHGKPVFAVTGWLVASLGCLGLVAAYSYQDAKKRAADWILASQPLSYGRFGVLALGLVAVVLNAWQFADWAAR
jgi:hypothetical protein